MSEQLATATTLVSGMLAIGLILIAVSIFGDRKDD